MLFHPIIIQNLNNSKVRITNDTEDIFTNVYAVPYVVSYVSCATNSGHIEIY